MSVQTNKQMYERLQNTCQSNTWSPNRKMCQGPVLSRDTEYLLLLCSSHSVHRLLWFYWQKESSFLTPCWNSPDIFCNGALWSHVHSQNKHIRALSYGRLKKRHDCKELSCQVLLLQVTKTRSAVSLIGMCRFSLCCAQEDDDSCWEASFRWRAISKWQHEIWWLLWYKRYIYRIEKINDNRFYLWRYWLFGHLALFPQHPTYHHSVANILSEVQHSLAASHKYVVISPLRFRIRSST